ncbi:MAG: hypothetical protein A2Z25_19625 [Planctomycetes bacterium RBG_16_55_9]|nr:MAG: hypothetical protein A2Z25_19625 [Planctomycetes bacterium RBG_16_55_9]
MNRRGGDIISLLGLFILALLLARFTVVLKSAIKLSEPISLAHTGLSVSMPMGGGWHSEQRWMYHDSSFILSSVFAPRSDGLKDSLQRATAWAHCQYRWAAKTAPPEDRFAWKASEVDGEIVETGRAQGQALTVDWVRIERPDFLLTSFWGTAELPNGRHLDIEVHQVMSDPELPKRIFNSILKSLSFEEDPLLDAGVEVAAAIKSKGLGGDLGAQEQRASYLIKDAKGQSIGFSLEALAGSGTQTRLSVRAAGFLYITGRNAGQQETTFQCSNNLDEFTYSSRMYSGEDRSGTEIISDQGGTMMVRKLGPQAEVKKYYPGATALPNVFFDHVLRQMLDSDKRRIVLDLIDVSGKIIPTYISRIEAEGPQAAYVFDLEFLDGRGFSQKVYLDADRQIYKSLIRQEDTYVLERTGVETIAKEFPEHARRILRNSRTL